jgi:hypothetical protein
VTPDSAREGREAARALEPLERRVSATTCQRWLRKGGGMREGREAAHALESCCLPVTGMEGRRREGGKGGGVSAGAARAPLPTGNGYGREAARGREGRWRERWSRWEQLAWWVKLVLRWRK